MTLSATHHVATALPTQRGLHPALTPLLALPIQALKAYGPRQAASLCDEVATGFLLAVDTDRLSLAGGIGLTAEDIELAAHWLARAARRLEGGLQ